MAEESKRTQAELEQSLKGQLRLLTDYCNQYDAGNLEYVFPMSTTLRVLLKDTRNCHSLLGQLGLKDALQFVDSAHHCKGGFCCWEINGLHDSTLIDGAVYAGLVSKKLKQAGDGLMVSLQPLCKFGHYRQQQLKSFDDWYNDEVLDDTLQKMTRKNVIENIAEKEGGCHYDTKSTPEQRTFQKPGSLCVVLNGTAVEFQPAPVYTTLRQIAWEVIESLKLETAKRQDIKV